MFSRILYADQNMVMGVHWWGLGAIEVMLPDGRKRRAHPVQKLFIFRAARELERCGRAMSPVDSVTTKMLKAAADALLFGSPGGLSWKLMLQDGPERWARSFLLES